MQNVDCLRQRISEALKFSYFSFVLSHSLALSELLRREATLTTEVGEASEYVGQLREKIRTITIDNAHLSRFGKWLCYIVGS